MLVSSLPTTNAAGEYDLGGLKAGTYRLGFSSTGGYISEYWDDAATVQTATDIVVEAGATASGKDARLESGSHITGNVTGPGGTGLQGVNVAPYQKQSGSGLWQQVAMSVTTNAAGDYDLGGLKAGTYRLGFATYMTGGFLPEYWDDAATVESATDIVVGASATVAGKNAQLATASHITGKVTGPDGVGLSRV